MTRSALRLPILLAAMALLAAAPPARANATCSERACDEQQIGPFVAPDIELPDLDKKFDPRGKQISIPLPGLEKMVVRHRSGAGVWLGEAPGRANLFLKPRRDGATVDMKLDF